MSRLDPLVNRLPSLYRPAPGGARATLFEALLGSVSEALDEVHRLAGEVLSSRWVDYADRAEYSQFFALSRKLQRDLDPDSIPYLTDLARVAAVLPLTPWEQPELLRESVEQFRLRLKRVVRLYRDGLATVGAVRAAVEAALPVALDGPGVQRDRPFTVEEFAPRERLRATECEGVPSDELGPLSRFYLDNQGLDAAAPTFVIQALSGRPAERPLLELYRAAPRGPFVRLGLGYTGTLQPGAALRVRPAWSSFAATVDGLRRARTLPTDNAPACPVPDGPYESVDGAPDAPVTALLQGTDLSLWVATLSTGGSLWRYDGSVFRELLTGLPEVLCLFEHDTSLLIGTAGGLSRMELYPIGGGALSAVPLPAFAGIAIHAICRDGERLMIGTARGVFTLSESGAAEAVVLGSTSALEMPVFALSKLRSTFLLAGATRGLFAYQRTSRTFYHYVGADVVEQERDFRALDADAPVLPDSGEVFLPPVRCLHRGPDASLWLGTDAGIARYVARPALTPLGDRVGSGPSLVTVLEAYPDVHGGRVYQIREDARGRIWFATDSGLFRYDGRDLSQRTAAGWVGLGRADSLYPAERPIEARGAWRFQRGSGRWQRFDEHSRRFSDFAESPRSSDEPEVRDVIWCTDVVADLGTFDGARFTSTGPVQPSSIVVHLKPEETRIAIGGMPGVPRVPRGRSVWRYLELEPAGYAPPTPSPAWTPEGRLVPPPQAGLPEAAGTARFDRDSLPEYPDVDRHVFAYPAAARVFASWPERRPRSFTVRLASDGSALDPAIVERVWQSIGLVRPLGVQAVLSVDEKNVKVQDGNGQ